MTLVVVSMQVTTSSHYRQSPCLPYVPNIHFHTYLSQFFAVCKSYFAYRVLPSFFVLLKGIVLAFRICVLYNFQCSNLFNMQSVIICDINTVQAKMKKEAIIFRQQLVLVRACLNATIACCHYIPQSNLSTTAIMGGEESGCFREVAVIGRQGCNMTPFTFGWCIIFYL